ncbi:UbiB domain [Trypanosoma melophagium]|uniref:UbiB domain n=1 Tax=Trypanosoma melophagium TaxID=715481 RepID=UPI00351A7A68|nr:UbiB domain [Trypanosoma melophagium]
MLSRSGVVHSWCNVSQGLKKILIAIGGSISGSTGGNNNNSSSMPARTTTTTTTTRTSAMKLPEDAAARLSEKTLNKEKPKYRTVPATRVGRAAGFASLFMQLGWDHLSNTRNSNNNGSSGGLLSSSSHQRIVETLCRMRGAVLKLGQMLSIQDSSTVPPHVTQLFERVRDSAYAMPPEQLNRTLAKEYKNANWRRDLFLEFDDEPMAAASIGQVHRAAVADKNISNNNNNNNNNNTSNTNNNKTDNDNDIVTVEQVAVKVQYPGVARSIVADVANLKMLITLHVLPPGMFVDNILQELSQELSMECRYTIEAAKQMRYAALVEQHPQLRNVFIVPKVYTSLSTDGVLVTQLVSGVPIDKLATVPDMQELKNHIAEHMLMLTLSELFQWRFMQTDPNYSNFLFDAKTNKISLLDFGAAREYSAEFVQDYLDVVAAAARQDRETIISKSMKLGFLTGNEMKEMLDAHVASVILLGKSFRHRDKTFDFAAEELPSQIQSYIPTMIKLRLRPPPTPVYSLHRRLSGTILLATKLKATINSGEIFWNIYDNWKV